MTVENENNNKDLVAEEEVIADEVDTTEVVDDQSADEEQDWFSKIYSLKE